jgi:hypothetical protein
MLVTAEQGMGDNFQFLRFVGALTALGASRVVVECHAGALSLFLASGVDAVAKGTAPVTDWYVPMLSLPHWLGTGADVAGDGIPYLRTGVAATPASTSDRRRIGVVWQGNPAFLATSLRDFDRSLLPQLLDLPDVAWVSLQYGASDPTGLERLEMPQLSSNWLDTAILLSQLDAVVTVDTGIAHLAGAMGRPTFVLLPFSPDWRWGLGTDTTPWYPSVRLIRQRAPRDWASTIAPLHAALSS